MHPQGRYVCYPERKTYSLEKPKVVRKVVPYDEEDVEVQKKKPAILHLIIWLLILGLLAWWFLDWLKKKMANKGRVIVAVNSSAPRLAALSRPANNLTKALAVIDHIQVLPSGQGKGWINISNTNQTIDLLGLRNASPRLPQIVADARVPVDQYQKVRFHISKIVAEDGQGAKVVHLPGNNIEFEAPFSVSAKKDLVTTIVLDIPLDESLRDALDEAGRPVKVFAPVINYETKGDSQVTTSPNKRLNFQKQGVVQGTGTVSMDASGQVDKGVGIASTTPLKVDKGKVVIPSTKGIVEEPKPFPNFVDRAFQPQTEVPLPALPVAPGTQGIVPAPPCPNTLPLVDNVELADVAEFLQFKAYPALIHGKYNRTAHK